LLGIYANEAERRDAALELRWGRITGLLLRGQALVTDDVSRRKLIEQIARDAPHASQKLARNAEGDFSPDNYVQRFPTFEATQAAGSSGRTLSGLAEAWRKAALARGTTKRDAKRMSRVMLRFGQWLGHDELARVSRQDAVRWATTTRRLAASRSAS
jgi:hypothetical protein